MWRTTAVVWAGLIFYLSTQGFGGAFTEWLLHQAISALHISVSASAFEVMHHLLRKSAHVTEYAIFAMLIYGSGQDDDPFRWRGPRALWSALIAGVYSLTDEFHQRFVPGRGPSLVDCGIDTAGASLGTLVFYLRYLFTYRNSSSTAAASDSALER